MLLLEYFEEYPLILSHPGMLCMLNARCHAQFVSASACSSGIKLYIMLLAVPSHLNSHIHTHITSSSQCFFRCVAWTSVYLVISVLIVSTLRHSISKITRLPCTVTLNGNDAHMKQSTSRRTCDPTAGMGAKLTTYYRRGSPTDNDHQRLMKGVP